MLDISNPCSELSKSVKNYFNKLNNTFIFVSATHSALNYKLSCSEKILPDFLGYFKLISYNH